jgi:hypothetical protein
MDCKRSGVSPSQETPLCCTHLAYETTRDVGAAGPCCPPPRGVSDDKQPNEKECET